MPNTQKENWKRELKIWVLDMKISRIYNLNVSSLLTKHFMVSSIFFAKVNSNRFTKLDKTQWRLDICCTYIYTISQWKIDKEPVERIFFVYNLHYCFICWACRSSLQFHSYRERIHWKQNKKSNAKRFIVFLLFVLLVYNIIGCVFLRCCY